MGLPTERPAPRHGMRQNRFDWPDGSGQREAFNHRGVDLVSDALPFGRLWYGEPNAASNAIEYANNRSRSHDAVIRIYDAAGNVIEMHEHALRRTALCG